MFVMKTRPRPGKSALAVMRLRSSANLEQVYAQETSTFARGVPAQIRQVHALVKRRLNAG